MYRVWRNVGFPVVLAISGLPVAGAKTAPQEVLPLRGLPKTRQNQERNFEIISLPGSSSSEFLSVSLLASAF